MGASKVENRSVGEEDARQEQERGRASGAEDGGGKMGGEGEPMGGKVGDSGEYLCPSRWGTKHDHICTPAVGWRLTVGPTGTLEYRLSPGIRQETGEAQWLTARTQQLMDAAAPPLLGAKVVFGIRASSALNASRSGRYPSAAKRQSYSTCRQDQRCAGGMAQ
ncbi:hypothetical protein FA95DRAFT_1216521 [Auriscalpium vulgare]|uniref:Uncharacterized protein n=1 Tax=Auriscalpium vulgare TaxID=40419 RepID=A0ACB8R315_9AGAM|nr:hypothetical protein FA95DRAFT_1216521 [Auriscalpium vulgare]